MKDAKDWVMGASVPLVTAPTPSGDVWDWITKISVGLIVFFLGWGLKDVKKRYDKVPELETSLALMAQDLKAIKRHLKMDDE